MITVYSTNCPKCKILEKRLNQLMKTYVLIDNEETVINFAEVHGLSEAPILECNGELYNFSEAMEALKYGRI